jgi:hypothetical protein
VRSYERKGLMHNLGFKLILEGKYYKFVELDCYMSTEEKKKIKWWEVQNEN